LLAYLVIREDNKWSDVYKLIPGRRITVGRSPANQIVLRSEQASRYHAEVFLNEGTWTVRDLQSRNGTAVDKQRVTKDHPLEEGQEISIANCKMIFATNLDGIPGLNNDATVAISRTESGLELESAEKEIEQLDASATSDQPLIVSRRDKPTLLERDSLSEIGPGVGQAAHKLCRLAFELASQNSFAASAKLAVESLFESMQLSAGGIWLVEGQQEGGFPELALVASRSDEERSYRRVSGSLSKTVVESGQAVLAQDIDEDSNIGLRDSNGNILAQNVICAPLRIETRSGHQVVGLIHLYNTQSAQSLGTHDLDFTLAVADNLAQSYKSLRRQQRLSEDLNVTKREVSQLREQLGANSEIVGSSDAMQLVHMQIKQAAPTNATVLIRGESGVGKELIARAVHFASQRNKGAFVCLNCAALSESLLESELFGHEKGAFTGATERKVGKFEAADGGTLVLDEIGEMSPAIQAKFLRVIEGHPFERVGGSKAIKVNVRVIAATNRDLEQAVQQGIFRKDLYFRLKVVEIEVPPMRKRREDVLEIADHFLERFCNELGQKSKKFSPAAVERLRHYRWPGNVREIKNVVERAVVLSQHPVIEADELALSNLRTASETSMEIDIEKDFEPTTLAEIERRHILQTLNSVRWNKSKTAQILGIERSTLDRKIKRYDLERYRVS